jgi:hypothetical protein
MNENPYEAPQDQRHSEPPIGFGMHSIMFGVGVGMLCLAAYAAMFASYTLYSIIVFNRPGVGFLNETMAALSFAIFSVIPFTIARRLRRKAVEP